MTKQDDAALNTQNPLRLRSVVNGGSTLSFSETDANVLNLLRFAGDAWSPRRYLRNEVVHHEGGSFLALADTEDEPPSLNWTKIDAIKARAGMFTTTSPSYGTIGAGWTPLTNYTAETYAAYLASVDLVAGTWVYAASGMWNTQITLSLQFTDSNQGRHTFVRLMRGATEAGRVRIAVGRNTDGLTVTLPIYGIVAEADEDAAHHFEIGGGSSISGVVADTQRVDLIQIGAF